MKRSILFALGVLLGAALPAALLVRLGQLTLAELRQLHVVVLEVKRRMSVAMAGTIPEGMCPGFVDPRSPVSFDAPGDPEGYSERAHRFMLDAPGLLGWLLAGGICADVPPEIVRCKCGRPTNKWGVHQGPCADATRQGGA